MSDLVRDLVHYFRCLADSIRENGLEDGHQTRVFATCINKNLRLGGAEQDAIQFSTVTYDEKRDCLNENVHIAVFHPDSHHQVAFREPDSVDRKRFPNLPSFDERKEGVCKVLELWADRIEGGYPVQGCFYQGTLQVIKKPSLVPSSTLFGIHCHQAFDAIWAEIVRQGAAKRGNKSRAIPVIYANFADWVDTTQKNVAIRAEERFPDIVSFDDSDSWPFYFKEGFYKPDNFRYLEFNCWNPATGQGNNRKMESSIIQESYGLAQLAASLADCLNAWLKIDSAGTNGTPPQPEVLDLPVRPKGKKPKRANDGDPIKIWELDVVRRCGAGGAQTAWNKHKAALQKVGIDSLTDFKPIHERRRKEAFSKPLIT